MSERAPLPRLLYSQGEAAAMLAMSTKRLVEQVRAGALRYVLDGKRRKFTPADLNAFIAARGQIWDYTSAPTRRSGGTRSRSQVIDFAAVAGRHRDRKR